MNSLASRFEALDLCMDYNKILVRTTIDDVWKRVVVMLAQLIGLTLQGRYKTQLGKHFSTWERRVTSIELGDTMELMPKDVAG